VQTAVEDRYRHQIGTVTEVANVRQLTAQARLAMVQATVSVEDSYLTLVTAMGISPLTRIKIADISGRRLSPAMAAPVQGVISAALARRPDIQSAYAAQKASLANVRVAEADFLPKIFLSGNGTYNSGNLSVTALPAVGQLPPTVNINGNRLGGTVLAGVAIPIYDGGFRLAKLAQAQAEVDTADAQMAKLRNDAVRQIVMADNALRTGLSTYAASQALTTAAQTSFDASLAAYRDGVGSITELTLAQTQLLQAKNASTDAYSLSLSAAATLALSMGALGTAPLR
jgi:outer membrane protein TolC